MTPLQEEDVRGLTLSAARLYKAFASDSEAYEWFDSQENELESALMNSEFGVADRETFYEALGNSYRGVARSAKLPLQYLSKIQGYMRYAGREDLENLKVLRRYPINRFC